jgi:antitoxin (DNA-binding transcriptional repressor) of toxin-antitoxin stability system
MRRVGIKTLKNELSKHIRAVAAGETILVTDRDRVVAELRPPPPEDDADDAARNWARMIREGIVTPAKHRFTEPPPKFGGMTLEDLMAEIYADRDDR